MQNCRPLSFNAPDECCPYSETFLTLSLPGNRHIHNESVFAHPFLKMWKFSEQKDRRTALILGIPYCERAFSASRCLTYIPSVGHWSVYFCSGLSTTFKKINEISLTLFVYPNPSAGAQDGESLKINEKDSIIAVSLVSDIRLL